MWWGKKTTAAAHASTSLSQQDSTPQPAAELRPTSVPDAEVQQGAAQPPPAGEVTQQQETPAEEGAKKKKKKWEPLQVPSPMQIMQQDVMDNCLVKGTISGVMGGLVGLAFGLFSASIENAGVSGGMPRQF